MTAEERKTALLEFHEKHEKAKAAGFAGVSRKTGFICDRRDEPDAIPMQENSLLGIPKPQPVPIS